MKAFLLFFSLDGESYKAVVFAGSEEEAVKTLESDGFKEPPKINYVCQIGEHAEIWYLA